MQVPRNPRRLAVVAGVLALLIGLIWLVLLLWPNPHLARAEELGQQLAQAQSAQERREIRSQLRTEVKQLAPQQRRNLFREQRQRQMAKYFSSSRKEKTAQLDAMIQRMEQMRREANNGTGQPWMTANRAALGSEEREKRRKERLDWSTPEEREMRSEFFRDLQQRRQQRGLGGSPWGRW